MVFESIERGVVGQGSKDHAGLFEALDLTAMVGAGLKRARFSDDFNMTVFSVEAVGVLSIDEDEAFS